MTNPTENREKDRKEIMEHIDSIFRAFADKDRDTLFRTHMEHWKGFTVRSRTVIRSRADYISEIQNFLEYQHWTSYEVLEDDIAFYDKTAIVTYIAHVTGNDSHMKPFESKLRIMDIYIDTDEGWNLAASSISLHPDAIDRHLTTAIRAARGENN